MILLLKVKGMFLTIIWVGFLGVRFEVWGDKITLSLKLFRIKLET